MSVITFKEMIPVKQSLVFDRQYEPELQEDYSSKKDILKVADITTFMFVDGKLAGETYGVSPANYFNHSGEKIEDTRIADGDSVYVWSTTILPEFRGKGYGKILKAYFLGQAKNGYFTSVIGHATSPEAVMLNAMFGAKFGKHHFNWYETNRVASFYRIKL